MTEDQLLQHLLKGNKLGAVHEERQFSNAGNNELPCFNYRMFLLLIYQHDPLVFRILSVLLTRKLPTDTHNAKNLSVTPGSAVPQGKGNDCSLQIC